MHQREEGVGLVSQILVGPVTKADDYLKVSSENASLFTILSISPALLAPQEMGQSKTLLATVAHLFSMKLKLDAEIKSINLTFAQLLSLLFVVVYIGVILGGLATGNLKYDQVSGSLGGIVTGILAGLGLSKSP